MSSDACTLVLLGQPRLRRAGLPDQALERRDALLLAVLALDGALPREQAIAWLWPGAERKAGQTNLRQRLFRLRRQAGHELVASAAVLRLAPGVVRDVDSYAERVAAAAAGPLPDDELLATLGVAERGPLAEQLERLRRHWHGRRQAVLAAALATHQQAARLEAALACAERLLHHEPGAENVHRQRMRLHYLRGDRSAALAAWAACRSQLREAAAAEPEAATLELAALIQRSGLPALTARRGLPTPTAVAAPPDALLRPPLLVGREAAWAQLQATWQGGRALLLVGEPGIGKSRLLADFLRAQAAAPAHGARPGDADQPWALLQRLLRELLAPAAMAAALAPWVRAELARLLPELGAAAGGRLEPLRLQRALAALLTQAHGCGWQVLAVDDFQFADSASQHLLLACLPQALPGMPLPWFAVRAGERPAVLDAWLAAQPLAAVTELQLPALGAAQVADFVQSLALPGADAASGWPPLLLQRTGGNPLFMLQLMMACALDPEQARAVLPDDMLRLVARRLSTLSPAALRVARVAALAGPAADAALVAQVLGVHAVDLSDAYAELQDALLIGSDGRFAYDVVHEAVRRGVPKPVAQVLHAALAEALAQRAAAPERVAHHHAEAGQWAAAARCLEAAASHTPRALARGTELELLDRAALAHQHAGAATAAWQAQLRALACAHMLEPADRLQARALALLASAADDGQRLAALLHRARTLLSASDAEAALAVSAPALQLAQQVGDAAARLTATAWHGLALALGGRCDEGLALLQAALPDAAAEPDARARLDFHGSLGYALHVAGRYRDAMAPLRSAAQLATELGELGDALEQTNNLAVCCNSAGDPAAEIDAAERVLAIWRQLGEPEGLAADTIVVQACTTLTGHGRYRESLALLPAAAARLAAGPAQHWAVIAAHRLAWLYLRLGQPARARQALAPLPAAASAGAQAARAMLLARLAQRAGQPAHAELQQAQARWGAALATLDRHGLLLMRAELTPDDEEAIALCDAVLAEAQAENAASTRRAAWLRRAERACAQGRHAAALADLRQAWAGKGLRPAHGLDFIEVCHLVAGLARQAGDAALCASALCEGSAWLQRVEAEVPAAFADSFRHRNPAVRQLHWQLAQSGGDTPIPAH